MTELPPRISALQDISGNYAAILCDVWGVLHNGMRPFAGAAAALAAARQRGIAVVLITNAPRLAPSVVAQLASIGVPESAWDRIITSGDVTRTLVAEGPRKVFHLGPDRDLGLYEGLDVEVVEEFEASSVCCTGYYDDDTEGPEDYADMLRRFRARNLPFVCANPDIMVEKGDRLIWCAGALARDYAQLGGRTLIAGKPHRPIYDAALKAAGEIVGRPLEKREALAIGDGMLTDVKGGADNGFDVLYVSAGIHAHDYGHPDHPEPDRLATFLAGHGYRPVAYLPRLR